MKFKKQLFAIVLFFLTLFVYEKIHINGFLFDDHFSHFEHPKENFFERLSRMYFCPSGDIYEKTPAEYIQTGKIPWWSHPDIHNKSLRPVAGFFRLLDSILFKNDPRLNYFHNVLWLFLCGFVFFALLLQIQIQPTLCFLGAIFFTFHPIFSIPVAFINNKNILISTFFSILCILCMNRSNIVYSIIFFCFAVLSSEQFICLAALYFFNYRDLKSRKYIISILTSLIIVWIIFRFNYDYDYRNGGALYNPVIQTLRWLTELLTYVIQAPVASITGKQIEASTALFALILVTIVVGYFSIFKLTGNLGKSSKWLLCSFLSLVPAAAGAFHLRYLAPFHIFFTVALLTLINENMELSTNRFRKVFTLVGVLFVITTAQFFYSDLNNLKIAWDNLVIAPSKNLALYCDRANFLIVNSPNPLFQIYYMKSGNISEACSKKIFFSSESSYLINLIQTENSFILDSESIVNNDINYFRDFKSPPHLKIGKTVSLPHLSITVLELNELGAPKKIEIKFNNSFEPKDLNLRKHNSILFVNLNKV